MHELSMYAPSRPASYRADPDPSPSLQRHHHYGRRLILVASFPQPEAQPAVRRGVEQIEDSLRHYFLALRSVYPHLVQVINSFLDRTKKQVAVGQEARRILDRRGLQMARRGTG